MADPRQPTSPSAPARAAESNLLAPTPAALKKSFAFGDVLGLATPGHLAAARRFAFVPFFARCAIRDLGSDDRGELPGLAAVTRVLARAGYARDWGAMVEGVRTEQDVDRAVRAGFSTVVFDTSAFIENRADRMSPAALDEAIADISREGVMPASWIEEYIGRTFELQCGTIITLERLEFIRAIVKFARSIAYAQRLARHLSHTAGLGVVEIDLAIDETNSPLSLLEHLVVALELRRRGIAVATLTPRFAGRWLRGVEYSGDLDLFEENLRAHVDIARAFGPYKLGFNHGSDRFALYPIIGRVCGELVHVKTRGTSYLEALRVVCRTSPELFHEIAGFARTRFEPDSTGLSCTLEATDLPGIFRTLAGASLEGQFLDRAAGRQFLHTTAGAVLSAGLTTRGRPLREAIAEILLLRADLYRDLLDAHFTRKLTLLNQG